MFPVRAANRPFRGLRTSSVRRLSAPSKHSSTYMVEEAYAYVQDESLKAYAALLTEAS